jgi:hypothetical protein
MSERFRARASVGQSLVRTVGKAKTSPRLVEILRGDESVQAVMAMPAIGWVEEQQFLHLLGLVHQHLGEQAYTAAVHDASMAMLKNGLFRAAQIAFTFFRKPGLAAYTMWAQRMWALSFERLQLTHDGEDPVEGVRMILAHPPSSGFTKPIVAGACGVVQTVFTFAKQPGRVRPLPHHVGDEQIELRLKADSRPV